jgi:hypothetical protein
MRPKWFLSQWYVRRKPCTYIALTLSLSPNGPKRDSTWPTHLGFPSGAFKTISKPLVCLAQTMQLSCIKISTSPKDSNKLPLEPHHLGVSSGAYKMISEPMVCLAQIVHLYCNDPNSVSKRTEMTFQMTHSPSSSIRCVQHDFCSDGTFDTNRASIFRQDYHYLQMDSNKLPLVPRYLGVSLGAPKTISKPMVCLA